MGKPAARVGDMHVCPMVTPGLPPIPHVGGPILPPGAPTVLIGGVFAATMGSMCTCVGPPDSIILGSMGVMIGGKPAARMGDSCAHGGTVILGLPTVLIGELSPGGGGGGGGAGGAGGGAAAAGTNSLMKNVSADTMKDIQNTNSLADAAASGDGLAPRTDKEDVNTQFTLLDEAEKPMAGVKFQIETNDGQMIKGQTDASGKTPNIAGQTSSDCQVTFHNT